MSFSCKRLQKVCPGSDFSKLGTLECGERKSLKHNRNSNTIIRLIPFQREFSATKHTKNDSRARSKSWNNISSAFVFANLCSRWNFRAADIWFQNRQRTFFKPERIVEKKRGKTFPLYIFIISRWKFIDITPVHFALIDMGKKISSCVVVYRTNIRSFAKFNYSFILWFMQLPGYYTLNIPCCWENPRTRCWVLRGKYAPRLNREVWKSNWTLLRSFANWTSEAKIFTFWCFSNLFSLSLSGFPSPTPFHSLASVHMLNLRSLDCKFFRGFRERERPMVVMNENSRVTHTPARGVFFFEEICREGMK